MYLIESPRLGLRELNLSDTDSLFEVLSDPETMQHYPKSYSRNETEDWILRSMKSYKENGFGLWAVILKEENKFIGQCGILLQDIDNERVPEIGYQINKKYWSMGFATEAALSCLNYGFSILNLGELYIHTSLTNVPSQRVAEKLGMIKKKEYDKTFIQYGITYRHVVYSIKNNQADKCKITS